MFNVYFYLIVIYILLIINIMYIFIYTTEQTTEQNTEQNRTNTEFALTEELPNNSPFIYKGVFGCSVGWFWAVRYIIIVRY